jgi:hypothetical protein
VPHAHLISLDSCAQIMFGERLNDETHYALLSLLFISVTNSPLNDVCNIGDDSQSYQLHQPLIL